MTSLTHANTLKRPTPYFVVKNNKLNTKKLKKAWHLYKTVYTFRSLGLSFNTSWKIKPSQQICTDRNSHKWQTWTLSEVVNYPLIDKNNNSASFFYFPKKDPAFFEHISFAALTKGTRWSKSEGPRRRANVVKLVFFSLLPPTNHSVMIISFSKRHIADKLKVQDFFFTLEMERQSTAHITVLYLPVIFFLIYTNYFLKKDGDWF